MDDARRARLVAYFNSTLKADRATLMRRTGLTKGRVAQLFDKDMPFGERAARSLAEKLGLAPDYFEATGGPVAAPSPANPTLARLTAYFLELGPDEQAVVMADLHARAARVVGERALQAATGYAPPVPAETPGYSADALRLAEILDHLSPEVRKRAFAQAQAALVKASPEEARGEPHVDAPSSPATTKTRAVRS